MLLKKLKELPVLQLAVMLLVSSFAIVMGACPQDNLVISGKVLGIQGPGIPEGPEVPKGPEEGEPQTPTAGDYDIDGLNQTAGSVIAVTVTPKSGKSSGVVTIFYDGKTELPSTAGTYPVTFDVAETDGWNAATGLEAGNLIIGDPSKQTPVIGDYNISSNLNQTAGSVTAVTVTAISGKSTGAVTVHYAGRDDTTYAKSEALPTQPGKYDVTFDVAAAAGWNPASALHAGILIIKGTPVAADYDIGNLNQTAGSVTAVTITRKDGKSTGTVTIKYNGSTTLPTTAGSYTVTFDVAAAEPVWNAAPGLAAGTLTITAGGSTGGGETEINYISGPNALNWGVQSQASVLTLGLTPGNDTTEVRLNWYAANATTANKVAKIRFIKGTATAGTKLIEVTGAAPTTAGSNTTHKATVTGLEPGSSYQYAVSSDGTNWSALYNFKVPAATGDFKFAVITDPQISTSSWDSLNRYTPSGGAKTAEGWKETMQKVVAAGVSFIAGCGDQIDGITNNNEAEYTSFFAPDGLRNLPYAPVPGNHDINLHYNYHFNWPGQTTTTSTSGGRNYYYRYNNILFVVLDTGPVQTSQAGAKTYIDSNFKTTIQSAKAAHTGKYDWLIVQHHKSTASVASHCADTELQFYVEGGFETLMSNEGVDFVITGHDHVYARSYPLQGMDGGKVSVPTNTTKTNTYTNPGNPIYLTFNTASGLKYYLVSADKTTTFSGTVANNQSYPYLGTDANGNATKFGSTEYKNGNLPVSNLAFSQALIPSYTIVDVNGRSITFKTYPIATKSGGSGTSAYSFDANTAYDWVTVTK